MMIPTKAPLGDQSMSTVSGLAPIGPRMSGQGDPAGWRAYVNVLYEVIRENYDLTDQTLIAQQGSLMIVEMEVDRLLALSKKWGDLLPFFTKEMLLYLCSNVTNLCVPAAVPSR